MASLCEFKENYMIVVKRSGEKENLTKKKIFDSICNANSAVDESVRLTQKQIKRITDSVVEQFESADG